MKTGRPPTVSNGNSRDASNTTPPTEQAVRSRAAVESQVSPWSSRSDSDVTAPAPARRRHASPSREGSELPSGRGKATPSAGLAMKLRKVRAARRSRAATSTCQSSQVISSMVRRKPTAANSFWAARFLMAVCKTTRGAPRALSSARVRFNSCLPTPLRRALSATRMS